MAKPMRYRPSPGTLASTVCIALALPPIEWPALIWIGLVPWLFALERCKTIGEAIAQGFWLNFLLGFTSAFWVAYAVPRYLGVSLVVGIFALFLHALVHQLQFAVFAGAHWSKARAVAPQSFLRWRCSTPGSTGRLPSSSRTRWALCSTATLPFAS
jgi:apolipoprotein N-acyltransferase